MKRTIKSTICILIVMNASQLFSQDYKKHKMFSHNAETYKISRFADGTEIGYMPDNTTLDNTINKRIKEIIQQNSIIGLQLAVVKKNTIVKTMHYGLSNIQDSILVDSKTVFSINSMTKAFTGVALMQLVEEGKIKLEEPISKYVDSLPKTWQNITVKQLATHTSGIPDVWNREGNIITEKNQTSLRKIKALPITFQPGERFGYNQTNYLLIGMLIEKITGKTFEKYLIENQFEKAGMSNSAKAGLADYYKVIQHSARSYTHFRDGSLTNMYEEIPENLRTAAGVYSTATEIAQWIIALQNRKFIKNEESLKTLWTPMLLNNGKTQGMSDFLNGYALGFYTSANKPVVASLGGVRSGMFIYPKDEVAVIILTNSQGFHPEDYLEEIANLYIEEKI